MSRAGYLLVGLFALAAWLTTMHAPAPNALSSRHTRLPALFVANHGQYASPVQFAVQGSMAGAYFMPASVRFRLTEKAPFRKVAQAAGREATLQLDFLHANPAARLEGIARAATSVSFFNGPPEQWRTGVPAWMGVRYHDLWPGIDLEFTAPDGELKYTFVLEPGAEPAAIRFAYRGVHEVKINPGGELEVVTQFGAVCDAPPLAWQESDTGREFVPVRFALEDGTIRFDLGQYDPQRALWIDPVVLVYAGYVGGGADEYGYSVAVDGSGNAYLTGITLSSQPSFPVLGGPDVTYNGGQDVFVAKVNTAGTGLVYLGYLGGAGNDAGRQIAVDASGNAYVVGDTTSNQSSFPVTVGPDLTHNGGIDAFIAKINASGTGLIYAGYIGGSETDVAHAVTVDSSGNAYVAGITGSSQSSFPVKEGPDLTFGGQFDGFVAKVNANGSALVYAGYIGGSGYYDWAMAIAVDSMGHAYVGGDVQSSQATFPVKVGPDLTYAGSIDGFVGKILPSGKDFVYLGYVGGDGGEEVRGIAIDGAGCAYVVGDTHSTPPSFPVLVGPSLTNRGNGDLFVAKVRPDGSAFAYSGFVGSAETEEASGIGVDAAGNAYVSGYTLSNESSFPVLNGPGLTHRGDRDAFVAKVSANGANLVYAGYIGGAGGDFGWKLAVDRTGNAYLSGYSDSTQASFPVTVGPSLTHAGSLDAFIAKIGAFPSTAGPVLAFRNGYNAIETNTFPDEALRNSGGSFRLDPAIAVTAKGNAFIAARDSASGIWLNYLKPDQTYQGWMLAGGNSPGAPAVAVYGEKVWLFIRDPWQSYWARPYQTGSGFGSWVWLQGVLATLPRVATCPNRDIYLVARDQWNGIWTRRWKFSTEVWQTWRFAGGITLGTPAVACGSDNAAYIAVRDMSNNMWLARVFEESSAAWFYGQGLWDGDLQILSAGDLLYVTGLSSSVPWYRIWQVGVGWQAWASPGGVLTQFAAAVYGQRLFLAGVDTANNLWWWNSLTNTWTSLGNRNLAAGSHIAAGAY